LSLQKLRLRKKRAAFAAVSVALGVVVLVTVNSLFGGLREMMIRTMRTQEIEPDEIKVYAGDNPYDYDYTERAQKKRVKLRPQYLTEAILDQIRGWPEVEAAERPVKVGSISVDALAARPQPVTEITGVPEVVLRRYAKDAALAATSNAIPLVVGERNVLTRFNEKTGKIESEPASGREAWIGREVTLLLGDNYTQIERRRYDFEKREFRALTDEEIAARREQIESENRRNYEMTVFSRTVTLKARVAGLCPGRKVLMPHDTALLCEKWLLQRQRLAARFPMAEDSDINYRYGGRRPPRDGEFKEAIVIVKAGADIEAVAKRIQDLDFSATTRAMAFENQMRSFESDIRILKRIAFAFGGVLLAIACGLIWSTTSKTVSDSRADIGLFRALGATKRDIRRLFLAEAALQGLLGTLLGIALGWGLALAISHWSIKAARRAVSDAEELLMLPDTLFAAEIKFCALLLLGAVLVSLLAGLWPATRAANIDPVKALKRE
jgi:ABC-type lipoprotein release transport system permease subunit